ncbi:MAG: 1-deoxy-D-xylulose-5-phosphate reductoisomerase [Lachnospiraceae bacterium]|nr:1-deoxy-D-xylulose-5-phosphate reductoisomerase [Lachnospiraceae bacterium]
MTDGKKKICILGCTGSIGRQTLDVIRKSGAYAVTGLAAGRDAAALEAQAREFGPARVFLWDEEAARDLKARLRDMAPPPEVLCGPEGMRELIQAEPADIFAISISGMIALRPVLQAIETGARIALSNKESIVTAGHIMIDAVKRCGAQLIPVDSEHSAVFQCLEGEDRASVRQLIITASGGPFRGRTRGQLEAVRPEQALRHPNWSMGAKITVDSATLANKGLEVMEAHHLFGVDYDRIRVAVHPQSVIHSMVEFTDGAVKAQLGVPDMRLPIEYALGYPRRGALITQPLDVWHMPDLHFEEPDTETFPALALAYEAGRTGGTLPTVFNAADELAVARFLHGELRFLQIADFIASAMAKHRLIPDPSLDDILETERWVRQL